MKVNISRESKILMGIVLLALGIYLWFNFLSQNNSSLIPSFLGGNSNSTTSQVISDPQSRIIKDTNTSNSESTSALVVAPLASDSQAISTVIPNANSSVATTAREVIIVDLPFLITEAPTEEIVITQDSEESSAQNRTLRATVNPFSPIIVEIDESANNRTTTASTSIQNVSGQSRPETTPIVGRNSSATANKPYTAPTQLIESVPLRTVTPAPALANNLPRTLATGTLSVTPGILRNQNVVPPLASEVAAAEEAAAIRAIEQEAAQAKAEAQAAQAEADRKAEAAQAAADAEAAQAKAEAQAAQAEADRKAEAARLAAIEAAKPLPILNNSTVRMPQNNTTSLPLASSSIQNNSSATLPSLLVDGRGAENIQISVVTEQNTETQAAATDTANVPSVDSVANDAANVDTTTTAIDTVNSLEDPNITGGPIEAAVSELARYLRDNNFQYTGSVIGVVSVGMFRTNVFASPITVTLGQTIPKTDIVLTNLQNNQAEFTQGQDKVILNLDLRR